MTRAALMLKRMLDIAVAAAGLLLLSPLMGALALLVRAKLGRPALFRQQRPGLHGEPFMLVKFRTMLDASDRHGRALPDSERLTGFGRWLRSTSLDELPELWNVLKGDMSLVGPRPLLMHYLPLYSPEEARRHEVRPGLTGWAQVNGRNALSWPEKFRHDIWYVDNWSLALDLKILAASVASVLSRRGIASSDAATMPEFTGSPDRRRGAPGSGPDRSAKD
jgi:lipopolysaccharide/colanic/teichoic acid biosynthesis glycosyltransferase